MNKFLLRAAFTAMLLLAAGRPNEKVWAQEKSPTQEKNPAQDGHAFKPLFNGKDLNGWKHVGPGSMTVEGRPFRVDLE